MPSGTGSAWRCTPRYFCGIGDEFGAAAGRAEIIGVAAMIGAVLGGVRIDRHAADRIEDAAPPAAS